MKELVERIAKALVGKPEDVVVSEVAGEKTTVLNSELHRPTRKGHRKTGEDSNVQ